MIIHGGKIACDNIIVLKNEADAHFGKKKTKEMHTVKNDDTLQKVPIWPATQTKVEKVAH